MTTNEILSRAAAVKTVVALLDEQTKNNALYAMADALLAHTEAILAANRADMDAARESLSEVMQDRLLLTAARITAMADGIREVYSFTSPAMLDTQDTAQWKRGGL